MLVFILYIFYFIFCKYYFPQLGMTKMRRYQNEDFANRVVDFYLNEGHLRKNITWNHFKLEGRPRSTIYRILQRYELTKTANYKPISGRPITQSTPKTVRQVEKLYKRNPSTSIRTAAKRIGIPKSTLFDIKAKNLGIVGRKKRKAPKYVKDQKTRAKKGCRKVYEKALRKILIID